jgi:hypothetical protein
MMVGGQDITLRAQKIFVDGQPVPVTADYTMRWVEDPGGSVIPVLYFQGRRLASKGWSVVLDVDVSKDKYVTDPKYGGSANAC